MSRVIPRGLVLLAVLFFVAPVSAAKLTITQPLGRNAYQTNEWIDLSVVRSEKGSLKKGDLTLTVSGADGSKFEHTFAVPGIESPNEAALTRSLADCVKGKNSQMSRQVPFAPIQHKTL